MWEEKDNALHATFKFADFSQAFAFMTEVAIAAEKRNHHPSWHNVWNTVRFELSTHDAGDLVTEKDHALAKDISRISKRYQTP